MPLLLTAFLALAGCSKPAPSIAASLPAGAPVPQSEVDHVLVVKNADSADSKEIADYYISKRHVPTVNVAVIHSPEGDDISTADYKKLIEAPIRAQIAKAGQAGHTIDYIILTRGIPIRLNEGRYSVDAFLVTTDLSMEPINEGKLDEPSLRRCMNPYYDKSTPFSHEKYNMYLVTRLTGYTAADAKKLVDRSIEAKPQKGLFFFDGAENRSEQAYGDLQGGMRKVSETLKTKGYNALYDPTSAFRAPQQPLAGYCGWGTNDDHYDDGQYRSLKFFPGAIAETFVSTSARSFQRRLVRNPDERNPNGQSVIADLIDDGVTGVKGYVSEPYTFALARPTILFDHYVSGMNLAESFYAASPILKWKDLVVGDPLCRPYRK